MNSNQKFITWFIAIWLFFQKTFIISSPLAMLGAPDEATRVISLVLNAALILLIIFIIQMKNSARLLAAICFSIALFSLGISTKILISNHITKFSAMTYVAISIIGNIFCIWFLLSPSYEKFCDAYQKEKLISKDKKKGTYINPDDLEK
jgi:hypothetical protein